MAGLIDLAQAFFMILFTILEAIPVVGAPSIPIGIGVDMIISMIAAIVVGILLWGAGMFYPMQLITAFMGEEIPLLNVVIPGWTLLVWRASSRKRKEEKAEQKAEAQVSVPGESPKNIDGIRAPNDTPSYA